MNPTMRGAAAHLVGSALILAAIAGGICVLIALLVGDSFLETLRTALWSFVAVFVLLGVGLAPSNSPARRFVGGVEPHWFGVMGHGELLRPNPKHGCPRRRSSWPPRSCSSCLGIALG
jgi:hypothetical protein